MPLSSIFCSPITLRTPKVPDVFGEYAGVLDIATAVDAVRGWPYAFLGDFGPCTNACPGEATCPQTGSRECRKSAEAEPGGTEMTATVESGERSALSQATFSRST